MCTINNLYKHLIGCSPEILLSGGKNGLRAHPEQAYPLKSTQMQRAVLLRIEVKLVAGFNGSA